MFFVLRTSLWLSLISLLISTGLLYSSRQAPPQTEWIAFVGNENGEYALYRMNPDGSKLTKIFVPSAWSHHLRWSPHGNWILYLGSTRNGQAIYRLSPQGTGVRAITPSNRYAQDAQWSPDGKWIAYAESVDGVYMLMLVQPNGQKRHELVQYRAFMPSALAWSPDSQWLAYSYYEFISRIRVDKSVNQRIYHTNSLNATPQWLPDGQALIYNASDDGPAQLYRVDLDTLRNRQLTHHSTWLGLPRLSPDGKWVVVAAVPENDSSQYRELYLVASTGGDLKRITTGFQVLEAPVWSPDSRSLLVISAHEGTSALYRMSLNGRDMQRLDIAHNPQTPAWSSGVDLPFQARRWLISAITALLLFSTLSLQKILKKRRPA